jgi:simple sugar transport system ATP-binding protein
MTVALVEMQNIWKCFPGVQANRGVDLCLLPGEIHALLGENGAGKTTLMSILAGMYRPDKGKIILKGQAVAFNSPQDAMAKGIGMIYQHFMLVPRLTVAENIILGDKRYPFWIQKKQLKTEVEKTIAHYGFQLDPDKKVSGLSLGEQQRVEILRALYRKSEVLILDEPTAVLTPGEARELFTILRQMADEGRAVILITHKLNEVMAVADRVTVLRKGEVVESLPISRVDSRSLTRTMIGRETRTNYRKLLEKDGSVALKVEALQVAGDRGELMVKGINLEAREGEMVAIAGVAGNGQEELLQALAGMRRATAGRVFLQGSDITRLTVRELLQRGVRMIPEDRMHTGLVGNLGVAENIILRDYQSPAYSSKTLLKSKHIDQVAKSLVERFTISTRDLISPIRLLSGGNLQRLMLARELLPKPALLLASYPARGLDVGAAEHVYALLDEARSQGTAILAVMEDLEEILQHADKVAVMYNGRLSPLIPTGEAAMDQLGAWMAGIDWPQEASPAVS